MDKSRRTFIKQSSIIIAGASLMPSFKVAASQGVTENIAIQLFSVDNLMNHDAAATLKSINKIGYQFVEHCGYSNGKFYGYSPKDFKQLVADNGLALLGGHTVLERHHWDATRKDFTSEWRQVIADACTAGQQFIITPWLDPYLWDKEKELKQFLVVLNKCGELCKKSGLQFGYHNHDFEFSHFLHGSSLYDIILKYTDPELVSQQLDIGNIDQEMLSIEALLKANPKRFKSLHIKNIVRSNNRNERYAHASLNSGMLDVRNIIHLARTVGGTNNFIVDQVYDCETSVLDKVMFDYSYLGKDNGMFTAV